MIAVDAFLVMVVLVSIAGSAVVAASRRSQRQHAPGGTEVYKLARRMAHALEGVLILDQNLPNLPNAQRTSIEALLKEWEKQL